eukprot:5360367-Prymnesium_polylepis.2
MQRGLPHRIPAPRVVVPVGLQDPLTIVCQGSRLNWRVLAACGAQNTGSVLVMRVSASTCAGREMNTIINNTQ